MVGRREILIMKDVDRSKFYDSQKRVAGDEASNPSGPQKELLILESRLERATGDDRMRLQQQIKEIMEKLKRDGEIPPTT